MTETAVLRWLCLLVPFGLTLVLWRRGSRRTAGAALLSFLASLVGIGVANQIAMAIGWWYYEVPHGLFMGIPLDLWLGWAILWGPVSLLIRLPVWLSCFSVAGSTYY